MPLGATGPRPQLTCTDGRTCLTSDRGRGDGQKGRVVHVGVWDSEAKDGAREQDGTHQSVCLICSVPRIDA